MNHSSQGQASQGRHPGPSQHAPGQYGQVPQAPAAPGAPDLLVEIRNRGLHRYTRVDAGEPAAVIRQAGQGTQGAPLAYVQVPQDAPKGGRATRPPFTVTGVDGGLLCSVRSAGAGLYDVYGADGAPIGRITRRGGRLLWPRRAHWSVQSALGGPPLAGEVGTVKGWVVICVISPLYFVCWAIMAAYGSLQLLLGDKEGAKRDAEWEMELPAWTRWRAAEGSDDALALEYKSDKKYRVVPSRMDYRLAYAQAVLHVWDRG